MRLIISGGPGSGCTSTAAKLSEKLRLPMFDSDSFYHKPTDPPFQEQYTPGERRRLVEAVLSEEREWIISGSMATWGIASLKATHGFFLRVPQSERIVRLQKRQREQFGGRIDGDGDMHDEHEAFIEWAAGYEAGTGRGRNLVTDREFLIANSEHFVEIDQKADLDGTVEAILSPLYGR